MLPHMMVMTAGHEDRGETLAEKYKSKHVCLSAKDTKDIYIQSFMIAMLN